MPGSTKGSYGVCMCMLLDVNDNHQSDKNLIIDKIVTSPTLWLQKEVNLGSQNEGNTRMEHAVGFAEQERNLFND